ncbi:MAG: thymidine phosphorylase, partial [Clostridia bacterium]|nr:thymidine phosphorylase [Clostridia bacterium]
LDDIGICLDKHSTGGVSDTTTLVVVPTLASLGVKVAKMSGRSLGWTGGTADKLEVFRGYKTEISTEDFKKNIKENGASIISQNDGFALADKIIYKLRSDSATVDNLGLIASSIMSKKIACGAKILILDVKFGSGAFMKTLEDAKKLATVMVELGKRFDIKVSAIISSMDQPLTPFVGNNLEVYSAIQTLNGEKNDLLELSSFICAKALMFEEKCKTLDEGVLIAKSEIASGRAKQKLKQIVHAQGGSVEPINNPEILLPKNNSIDVVSEKSGFVVDIDTTKIGYTAHDLQKYDGVLERQDDVGVILNKKIGDEVKVGEKLLTIYYNKLNNIQDIVKKFQSAFSFGNIIKTVNLIEDVVE